MPVEEAPSPPRGGSCGDENRAEEPPQAVYLVPLYAVAIVDPNELGEDGLPLNFGGEATGPEVAVERKRQKLATRKKGTILQYDDDDPHKPTPKRLRNRMKSQKSRDKKKAYMNALEIKVKELEKMISELEEKCLILQNENEALKKEALETDPSVVEKLMLYYEKLQKDKENRAKSVEKQDAPGKTAESLEGTLEKFAEDMREECALEIDIDDGAPETKIKVKCIEADAQEGTAGRFAEADDLECTSEINAVEGCSPLELGNAKLQEGTLLRSCTEIRDDNFLNAVDSVAQHSVTKASHSSQ